MKRDRIRKAQTMEALMRIGLVEDHDYLREVLEQMIRLCGYDTGSFDSAEAFLTAAGEFDCIVVDLDLPGMTGLQLEESLRGRGVRTPVILTTGYDPAMIASFGSTTAIAVLRKPFEIGELQAALQKACGETPVEPGRGEPESRGNPPC